MVVTRRIFLQALAAAAPAVAFFDIGGAYAMAEARLERAGLYLVAWGEDGAYAIAPKRNDAARFMEAINKELVDAVLHGLVPSTN